jgi:hypothetical protein
MVLEPSRFQIGALLKWNHKITIEASIVKSFFPQLPFPACYWFFWANDELPPSPTISFPLLLNKKALNLRAYL